MLNVRLAGDHQYGKELCIWLSLMMSLMPSFVLSFSPLDVLDEIWDLIESVSEGFLTYSYKCFYLHFECVDMTTCSVISFLVNYLKQFFEIACSVR